MLPRTTEHLQRVTIIERHLAGERLIDIADSLDLNYYTVRKWWRIYRAEGWTGLEPHAPGPTSAGPLSRFDPLVKYVVLRLKRAHPAWGLDLLRLHLSRRPSLAGKPLPRRSALGAYLHSFSPRLKEHRPLRIQRPARPSAASVVQVHQCWQIDFKGEERIPGVGLVKPFIVCDKLTRAPLAALLHANPQAQAHKVELSFRQVQHDLRTVFSQWGLPDQLQLDRDPVLVGSSRLEWPGTLLLWLVGLGITPLINRPHRPTDNAQVERSNRTWDEHVCIGAQPQTLSQLQATTDQAWRDRREALPSRNPHCHGLPPLVAHPELAHPRRPYSPDQEADLFQMARVYLYLSQWQWERKVDPGGCMSMAHLNRRIADTHIGQIVKVRFDPEILLFVARAVDGTELRRFTLPVISADYILGLNSMGT